MGANRELVERIFQAENRGDFEAAAAVYAPDATYVDTSGTIRGRAAIAESYRASAEAFPDGHREIERVVEEGDWVAFEGRMTATHTGPLRAGGATVPATGRHLELRFMGIGQVRNAEVVYVRIYLDQLDVMKQLGLMPAPVMVAGAMLGQLWNQVSRRLQQWRARAAS